jgi:predicted SnoaL-like aldol condensation-catalyzing enzyme
VTVADGDFVIVHGHFSGFGAPLNWIAADIVRIQAGILVEHWDVIQDEALRNSRRGKPLCSVIDFRPMAQPDRKGMTQVSER